MISVRCQFIFSRNPGRFIFSGKKMMDTGFIAGRFIFSGKNDELTPDFSYELTPDFSCGSVHLFGQE